MTRRRLIFFAALMAVFAGSIVAWTTGETSFKLNINPYNYDPDNPDNPVGRLVLSVTPIGETFSIVQGKAQKIAGIELYEIVLAAQEDCDDVEIYLAFQNAYDMGKVFNNPHSFLDVGVWYPVDPGGDPESCTLTRTGQTLWKDEGDEDRKASAMMSEAQGTVVLKPSKTVTSTIHILASIIVPGGAPPGQQGQLLKFWIQVKK